MLEAVGEVFPEAKYRRCTFHFYRNETPRSKAKPVAKMLKAIYTQESKKAARDKVKAAKAVVRELWSIKMKEVAEKVEDDIDERLTYYDFPLNIGSVSTLKA